MSRFAAADAAIFFPFDSASGIYSKMQKRPGVLGVVPPRHLTERVAALVRTHGLSKAAAMLGLSREGVARIGMGATCREGSIVVADGALSRLHEPPRAA